MWHSNPTPTEHSTAHTHTVQPYTALSYSSYTTLIVQSAEALKIMSLCLASAHTGPCHTHRRELVVETTGNCRSDLVTYKGSLALVEVLLVHHWQRE